MLQILDLENFATAYRLSKYVIKLAEKGGRSERDKLGRRWSTDNTSRLRCSVTVVYRTDHQALSTARFCHAGQSARADTYLFIHYTVSQKSEPPKQISDVDHLKERLIEEWRRFDHNINDRAVNQWRD